MTRTPITQISAMEIATMHTYATKVDMRETKMKEARRVAVKRSKRRGTQDLSFPPPLACLVPLIGGTMGLGRESCFARTQPAEWLQHRARQQKGVLVAQKGGRSCLRGAHQRPRTSLPLTTHNQPGKSMDTAHGRTHGRDHVPSDARPQPTSEKGYQFGRSRLCHAHGLGYQAMRTYAINATAKGLHYETGTRQNSP